MSKQRIVNDSFWTDPYIEDLDRSEKLIFLWLLTNPLCNVAGIYEVKTRRVAFETGIETKEVEKVFEKFIKDEKIIYVKGWVFITNFVKHQSSNPSVLCGISRILQTLPEPIDRLLADCPQAGTYLTLLNSTLLYLTGNELDKENELLYIPLDGKKEKLDIRNLPDGVQLGATGIKPPVVKYHLAREFTNAKRAARGLPPIATPKTQTQKDYLMRCSLVEYFKEAVNEHHAMTYFTNPMELKRDIESENSKFGRLLKIFFYRCGGDFEKAKAIVDWFALEDGAYCNYAPHGCFRIDTVVKFENRKSSSIQGVSKSAIDELARLGKEKM